MEDFFSVNLRTIITHLAKMCLVSLTMMSVSCSEMLVAVSPITSSSSLHLQREEGFPFQFHTN